MFSHTSKFKLTNISQLSEKYCCLNFHKSISLTWLNNLLLRQMAIWCLEIHNLQFMCTYTRYELTPYWTSNCPIYQQQSIIFFKNCRCAGKHTLAELVCFSGRLKSGMLLLSSWTYFVSGRLSYLHDTQVYVKQTWIYFH